MPSPPLAGLRRSPSAVFRTLVRWDEWYDAKLPMCFVCMSYAGLVHGRPTAELLGRMGALVALICVAGSFGYMINDVADRAADRRACKRGSVAQLAPWQRPALLLTSAAAVLLLVPFLHQPDVVVLVACLYALAALYSLPPVRLKERGTAGLFAPALAQCTLPALVVFRALGVWDRTSLLIVVLNTMIGVRWIAVHEILDFDNDVRAGVQTFATRHGADRLRNLLTYVLFPLELTVLTGAVLSMAFMVPVVGIAAAAYVGWLLAMNHVRRRLKLGFSLTTYHLAPLADVYFVFWPALLASMLALREPIFVPFLLLTLAWQRRQVVRHLATAAALCREMCRVDREGALPRVPRL